MKKFLLFSLMALVSCAPGGWTSAEQKLINDVSAGPVMRVLTVDDPSDSLVLRSLCSDIDVKALKAPEFALLAERMLATVTSPEQDGVGIAGPQVGVLRRVVAVQRFDKDGEPFEVYPNIRITAMRGEFEPGPEGCLSVPGRRGQVLRSRDIDISYTSPLSMQDTTERVQGFTAVIFQHECDHLDGILYIDKLDLQ
ncbi:MAG: peptide deformylase [Bacteroidales bacterium]|nr:peptide deformylase [Bacteroidales bacterium]